MYEQIAKDQVKERLKKGVDSQVVYRAIDHQKSVFSLGARIASWFVNHSISRRVGSQDDRIRESERVNLITTEETP